MGGALLPGIRHDAVTSWLRDAGALPPPYRFELVPTGRTNLTYRVTGRDGRSVALRRPLHDSADTGRAPRLGDREYRIVSALARRGFPVPTPVGWCGDPQVTGAAFAVVEWSDGCVLSDAATAMSLPAQARAAVGRSFIQALAALHMLDVDDAGLAGLRRDGTYLDCQIRAWRGQALAAVARSSLATEDAWRISDRLNRAADLLGASQRGEPCSSLLHGDYCLDNVILSKDGLVRAVLDWELAAVGDPLADAAYAILMWEPFDSLGRSAPTSVEGFCSSTQLFEMYRAAVNFAVDPVSFGFHVAFAVWRSACTGAVVLAPHESGSRAGAPVDVTRATPYITHHLDRCFASFEAHSRGHAWNVAAEARVSR